MNDLRRVREILRRDAVWAVYGLADLQPSMQPLCTWTVADSGAGEGLTLLFAGLEPPVLLTVGTVDGVAEALARTPRPPQVYLSVREEHLPAVRRYYDDGGDHRPMWRMVLSQVDGLTAPRLAAPARLVRLGDGDGPRLARLYSHGGDFAPDAFDPAQLADGFFWGVEEKFDFSEKSNFLGRPDLIAAGGTHIVNRAESVAAIGNIYTHPDQRGRGYGRAITVAVAQSLVAHSYCTIALNVDQRNAAAVRLYQQSGFTLHCGFVEGVAVKNEE
jgi:ribosomal protein S18 acetylase RimI-like enzyme